MSYKTLKDGRKHPQIQIKQFWNATPKFCFGGLQVEVQDRINLAHSFGDVPTQEVRENQSYWKVKRLKEGFFQQTTEAILLTWNSKWTFFGIKDCIHPRNP